MHASEPTRKTPTIESLSEKECGALRATRPGKRLSADYEKLTTLLWRHNGVMASQITSLTIIYSIVYSVADQRKHQSSASLAFVRGIRQSPVNSPHKWPVTRKCFHLMTSSCTEPRPLGRISLNLIASLCISCVLYTYVSYNWHYLINLSLTPDSGEYFPAFT